jgi:hypothetical protein
VDGPRSEGVAQVTAELQAGNLERGRSARKSRSGRARMIRRGPRKAVVGAGMKVHCTVREGKPEGGEAQEGSERYAV